MEYLDEIYEAFLWEKRLKHMYTKKDKGRVYSAKILRSMLISISVFSILLFFTDIISTPERYYIGILLPSILLGIASIFLPVSAGD